MKYYSAINQNGILPFAATWMDLEVTMGNEVSQTEKDRHCMTTYMQNLSKKTKPNKQKPESQIQRTDW